MGSRFIEFFESGDRVLLRVIRLVEGFKSVKSVKNAPPTHLRAGSQRHVQVRTSRVSPSAVAGVVKQATSRTLCVFLRAAAQRRGALVAGPHEVEHSARRGETHTCSTRRSNAPLRTLVRPNLEVSRRTVARDRSGRSRASRGEDAQIPATRARIWRPRGA